MRIKPYCAMSRSIISVNGSKAMNFLLRTTLEKDFAFYSVSDAFQAMHRIRTGSMPTLLIVDTDFHTQQCWDFIQHIKSSKLYRLPVVVLSSMNDDLLHRKCYEYEVDEVFIKPFNPEDIALAVQSIAKVMAAELLN
jgi:CheY-like chemotaxis protein